ncbi:MAG TPA: hypothetical protein VK996_11895 [Ramlibacter sp.]|nr:hypothetical protein [Ramlibacter sp.]
MPKSNTWIAPLIFLATLAPGAFAFNDSSPLSMVYSEGWRPAPDMGLRDFAAAAATGRASYQLGNCQLKLRTLQDLRRNKETVGAAVLMDPLSGGVVPVHGISVRSGDGAGWLEGAAQSLASSGVRMHGTANTPGQRDIDIALRMAHVWAAGMNLYSHVVLVATVPQSSGSRDKRYHGFGSKMNMNSFNFEFMTTLNLAMNDALELYAIDLRDACAGKAIPE